MDEQAVMQARQQAIRKGNKHWRRGKSRQKDRSNNQKAREVRAAMDTDRAPDFAALIPLNAADQFPVDARKLHAALGNTADFPTWWSKRISAYGFEQGIDFEVFQRMLENPANGRPAKNYVLTLWMSKHLAMVEKTEMGRKVRDYFIECETRLHERRTVEQQAAEFAAMPKSAILRFAAEQADRIEHLEARNATLEPKAEALDTLSAGTNSVTLQKAGNQLGIGRTTFTRALKEHAIFQPNGQPYRRFIDAGYFEVKPTKIWKGDQQENYPQVFVTQPGLTWLASKVRQWGLVPARQHGEAPVQTTMLN